MKILTWNCNGAFRRKYKKILEFDADVMVVQECEDPSRSKHVDYIDWARNYYWVGDNKNRGLGVFCKESVQISINKWEADGRKYFASMRINDDFDIVAVWTQAGDSLVDDYIGQFWKYLQINKKKMGNCIVIGDLNSNSIWDKKRRPSNHSNVVRELGEIGVVSIYHELSGQSHGQEDRATFFMHRDRNKPYHIDYIFASKHRFPETNYFEIGDPQVWLEVSDHMPVIAVL